jgi:hypothetical protein
MGEVETESTNLLPSPIRRIPSGLHLRGFKFNLTRFGIHVILDVEVKNHDCSNLDSDSDKHYQWFYWKCIQTNLDKVCLVYDLCWW